MAGRTWPVVNESGVVVDRFPTRAAARAYAKANGLRGHAEYRARVAPKVARGLSLSEARGHPPGGGRVTPRHRTKAGAVVREQWSTGLADAEGQRVTIEAVRRRLRAFEAKHPGQSVVGVAAHGHPYKERPGKTRWTGWLQDLDDFRAQLEDAADDGLEFMDEIEGLADRGAWESIDQVSLYAPGA